jgi:hypothetical protein
VQLSGTAKPIAFRSAIGSLHCRLSLREWISSLSPLAPRKDPPIVAFRSAKGSPYRRLSLREMSLSHHILVNSVNSTEAFLSRSEMRELARALLSVAQQRNFPRRAQRPAPLECPLFWPVGRASVPASRGPRVYGAAQRSVRSLLAEPDPVPAPIDRPDPDRPATTDTRLIDERVR